MKKAFSLFAYKGGIKLFAAKGKIELQAQSDNIDAAADKAIKLIAVNGQVFAAAGKKITLTSGGAFITLEGGNIKLHAPGLISIKGAQHQFSGPATMGVSMPQLTEHLCKECIEAAAAARSPFARTQ